MSGSNILGVANGYGGGAMVESERALRKLMERTAKAYREAHAQYDPVLLAAGIKAPLLTRKQKLQNMAQAAVVLAKERDRVITEGQREAKRDARAAQNRLPRGFYRTVEGRAVREEVARITGQLRYLGQVRNR